MTLYYVVTLNGVPVDVSRFHATAKQRVQELEVAGKVAQIVPVTPLQTELPLDFESEDPTSPF